MNNVKKSIGWCDYTINPVKGLCPMHCKTPDGYEYCYAAGERGLYKRFKWNPEIRYDASVWDVAIPRDSKIFVGSTIELFGDWVKPEWLKDIFTVCKLSPMHTFIFLTKQPLNALRFMGWQSDHQHHRRPANKLPDNVWMGVSVTNHLDTPKARDFLLERMARVNFLSIEPLLGHFDRWSLSNVVGLADWVIIGQQTPASIKTSPKMSWIQEILVAAHNSNISVFMKNNLEPLLVGQWAGWKLRQEFPK